MPDIRNSILETVGRTPLVRLNRIFRKPGVEILAKLESFNPCGSVKERIAVSMLEGAERDGTLRPGLASPFLKPERVPLLEGLHFAGLGIECRLEIVAPGELGRAGFLTGLDQGLGAGGGLSGAERADLVCRRALRDSRR